MMEWILFFSVIILIIFVIVRMQKGEEKLEKIKNTEEYSPSQLSKQNQNNYNICNNCGNKMTLYECSENTNLCSSCTLSDYGLIRENEKVIFTRSASYRGGLKGHPSLAKKSGFAFILSESFCFYDHEIECKIDYVNIKNVELQKFKPSGFRAVLAGGAVGRQLQEVKNNIAISFVDDDGLERKAIFQIHGALSIPGEEIKATEFLNYLLDFKGSFKSMVNVNNPIEALRILKN